MYSNVSVFRSACMKDVIKAKFYRKLKTEMRCIVMTRNKNTWCLVLEKVVALKGDLGPPFRGIEITGS